MQPPALIRSLTAVKRLLNSKLPFFTIGALFLALTPIQSWAQVVVNEFSCSNYSLNVAGNNEDFIELYNPTAADINVGGWHLSDNVDNPTKFSLPAGTTVPAGGFLTVICSGSALVGDLYDGGFLNTNFRIHQCKEESVVWADAGGNILESYSFGQGGGAGGDVGTISTNQADHSWARETDGMGDWRICTDPSPDASNLGSAAGSFYAGYAPTPQMGQAPGYHPTGIAVDISAAAGGGAGFNIYYTLDGYQPSTGSLPYGIPLALSETAVVRAVTVDPTGNLAPSFTATNTFFIGDDSHTIRVVSVSGDGLEDGSWNGDEPMHIEFFNEDGSFWVEAEGDSNEHGNDSNGYAQRGFDYITRDQMGYEDVVDAELFHAKNRGKFQRLIFKAAANDNYPFEPGAHIRDAYLHTLSHKAHLHVDERTNESCVLYINGLYWGVYEYREKVDDSDFTKKYYDQTRYDIDFLKTWGGTWEEYGSGADWYDLVNYATTQDLTVDANYQYVVSQLNEMSLIDYFVLNSYIVCMDWLNWNTAWWRGRNPDGDGRRWRYALWDLDASLGHYINYTGVPDTSPEADPCNPEAMGDVGGQGHIPVLNALMDNDTFWNTYINRWADLGNTYFTCDYMHSVLDSMVMVIAPEMPRQCERWGGDVAGWEVELQQMRDFIDERCESSLLSGMEDCYDVTPAILTVLIDGIGEVELNSIDITLSMVPYTGWYFVDVPISLEGQEIVAGAEFLYWEVISGDLVVVNPTEELIEILLTGDATIMAHFGVPEPPELVEFDVNPAGAGNISLDGVVIGPYPDVEEVFDGNHPIVASSFSPWWSFSGWTTASPLNLNSISPALDAPTATLSVDTSGTVIANFDYIEHVNLVVDIRPAGSGKVEVVNSAVVYDHWESSFATGGVSLPQLFVASPSDNWTFDHWEVEGGVSVSASKATDLTLALPIDGEEHVVAIFTEAELSIYIPNAFTPDNDGLNDAFLPIGEAWAAENYHFQVFDRWGREVFSTEEAGVPWIGQNLGTGDTETGVGAGEHWVRDGVYLWSVWVKWAHGLAPERHQGSVTVIR